MKAARGAGDSWTVVASALDTTRQAARQCFGGIGATRVGERAQCFELSTRSR